MNVSWDVYSPNMEKKHVPNHQPENQLETMGELGREELRGTKKWELRRRFLYITKKEQYLHEGITD